MEVDGSVVAEVEEGRREGMISLMLRVGVGVGLMLELLLEVSRVIMDVDF